MNRKGFTLIELLAVIILVALIGVLVMPSVIDTSNKGKQASYNILIKNIVTASKSYYEECEYGDLSNTEKYGGYACEIKTDQDGNNYIEITLSVLANTGFLSVKDVDNKTNEKLVFNPKAMKEDEKDISNCEIRIEKRIEKKDTTEEISKVTYTITSASPDNENCPSTKDYATTEVNSSEESESVE
ncbi:MAG: type II secretion system protein [Bacilli bacterium]